MKQASHRSIEIVSLTVLVIINLYSICWGPPDPPAVPVPAGNIEMSALTIAGVAAYGFWKMRK